MRLSTGLLALGVLCASAEAGAVERFALVVGHNQGRDESRTLRYAERDARKIRDVLQQLGDFPASNITLLLGVSADEVQAAVERLERRIARARRAGRDAILLVYYSGHADGEVLQLGRSQLGYAELMRFVRGSAATLRLMLIDSCHSGRLVAAKVASKKPSFPIRLDDRLASSGYAILTSSTQSELSQESVEVRGSFFTHYLVSALRGAADRDANGAVNLTEAYGYVYRHTVARTAAHVGGGQHPMYDFELKGRGDVPLTWPRGRKGRSPTGVSVVSDAPGRLLLMDRATSSLIAESSVAAGRPSFVSLRPAEYVAFLVASGATYRAALRVREQQVTRLVRERHFETFRLREAVSKGGLFRPIWSSHLGAAGVLRRWPLAQDAAPVSYGVDMQYALVSPAGWYAGLGVRWLTAADEGASQSFSELGLTLSGGHLWKMGLLRFRGQLSAGYDHLFQADREGEDRHGGGFAYGAGGGAGIALGHWEVGLDATVGGRLFKTSPGGTMHEFDLLGRLGAAWRFDH